MQEGKRLERRRTVFFTTKQLPHHAGFLLLFDEMDGEEEVKVQVDLVGGLHVLLELVGGGRPEGDHRVAEPAEDGG